MSPQRLCLETDRWTFGFEAWTERDPGPYRSRRTGHIRSLMPWYEGTKGPGRSGALAEPDQELWLYALEIWRPHTDQVP